MKNEREFLYRLLLLLVRVLVGIYVVSISVSVVIVFGGFLKEIITPAMMELLLGTLKNI